MASEIEKHRVGGARLVWVGLLMVGVLAAGCKLDPSGKVRCLTSADCLSGHVCLSGECSGILPPPVDCDPVTNRCSAAPDGTPRTCYQVDSLGGKNFCTQVCDVTKPPTDPANFACVGSGALLQRCHPNGASSQADCPDGLMCFRTSLGGNAGLCLRMPVCSSADASDCSGTHPVCASSVVSALSPAASYLPLDHLNCVHLNCRQYQSACASTESCPGTDYSPVDLCLPNCDPTTLQCPPNYSCARTVAGPGAPTFCLPGLPGVQCTGDNCIFGTCDDTGAGFRACAFPCVNDSDCSAFDTAVDPFVCVPGGVVRHCVNIRTFTGLDCTTNDQCQTSRNEFCAMTDVLGRSTNRGACRAHCNADAGCAPQGGVAFSCLQGGAGGCYPGSLGVPCTNPTDCVAPLTCLDVVPEADLDAGSGSARVCSLTCGADAADADAQCGQQGFCSAGSCRLRRAPGQPCGRNAECSSTLCDVANSNCLPPVPTLGL